MAAGGLAGVDEGLAGIGSGSAPHGLRGMEGGMAGMGGAVGTAGLLGGLDRGGGGVGGMEMADMGGGLGGVGGVGPGCAGSGPVNAGGVVMPKMGALDMDYYSAMGKAGMVGVQPGLDGRCVMVDVQVSHFHEHLSRS